MNNASAALAELSLQREYAEMSDIKVTRMSLEKPILRQDEEQTGWERLKRKEEAGIEPGPDPDEHKFDGAKARGVVPPPKTEVSIQLDDDVLNFFKSKDDRYHSMINAALRIYMRAHREASPAQATESRPGIPE